MKLPLSKNKMIALIVICLLVAIIYVDVFRELISEWMNNPDYSHGFFIPFMAIYMIWNKRNETRVIDETPSLWGLPVLFLGIAQFMAGKIGAEHFIQGASMIFVILGITLVLWGRRTALIVLIPIVYLIFMIPLPAIIWNKYAFTLRLFATQLAAICIQSLGVTVLREGNVLYLPSATLEVVDACSGMRSLISLLALSVFIGFLSQLNVWKKWLLFFAAIPIAIVSNIIRLILIAVLGEDFGIKLTEGLNHSLSGIFVFMIGTFFVALVYLVLDRLASERDHAE